MGFNAGGTNVTGIKSIEPGIYNIESSNTTLSVGGGETMFIDYTVPAGKVWIVKQVACSVGSFVGTLSAVTAYTYDGSLVCPIGLGSNASSQNHNCPQPITLTAGLKIRFRVITSAWTSGQLALYLGIQEINV